MLLQASQKSSITEVSTTNLWHPLSKNNTKTLSSPVPLSSRAQEIKRSKEEMLGLLKDMPESDYELSLTDLVEKKSAKEKESIDDQQRNSMKEKKKKDWRKKRSSSSSSFRSSSDGVLLNFFMPVSLTRSLTTPRGRRGSSVQRDFVDYNNRESGASVVAKGCWPAFLFKRRDKSK